MTIPAPTMLHLIACVRTKEYQPIARYQDDEQLIVDLAMAYQKIIQAFYDRGCRLFNSLMILHGENFVRK